MASTVLALLDEPDYRLKEYALQTLGAQVNELWPEIADHIPLIEELHEDGGFPAQHLAALVVSQVYYNLGDLDLALHFALAAGSELDLTKRSEFVDTVISHGIKTYISERQARVDDETTTDSADFDKLEKVVEEMLERCFASGQTTLALGVALEARRLDLVEAQLQSAHEAATLAFVLDVSVTQLRNRRFREQVLLALNKVVDAAMHLTHDFSQYYVLATKIAVQLDSSELAVRLLAECRPEELALQVAFDLVATASQELRDKTAEHFGGSPRAHHAKIVKILGGVPTCDFQVSFLERHCHADGAVLQATKQSLDSRNSMFHSALSFQNALLHLGTTRDTFLRDNIDWLGQAKHWTRFTATAALGVIHQGNLTQGRRVLQPYLSKTGADSAHIKGGAFYGLGLVFAGFGKEVVSFLQEQLTSLGATLADEPASDDREVLAHGACLGAALAGMRSQNSGLYGALRDVLYTDATTAGEMAGVAMGLVMLGSRNAEAQDEMLGYARSSEHERVVRSLAVGLALLNYGKEEASDPLVSELLGEHDAVLRYGGCFTLALAYAGTASGKATKRLLHTAVSDSSDDVRRAAMMALGFIYIRNPSALPRMVELLSESHNPHVRYGTAVALGVACAGTGLVPAVDVLEPLLEDPTDFVRQGAMVALAMILVQHTEQSHPRARSVREHLAKITSTKNEDALAKFGAALAQGIIDAGGCNTTITLEHRQTSNLNMRAVTGLAVFLQYWYWYPLAHFMSLAFTPTTVVGVTEDLRIPELELECVGAPAKRFDYPPKLEVPTSKPAEQLVTAILSTTLRERRKKNAAKEKEQKEKEQKEKAEKEEKEKSAKEKEQQEDRTDFAIANMSRVVPWQRRFVRLPSDSNFGPVAHRREPNGVLVVQPRTDKEITYIPTLRQTHAIDDEQEDAPLPRPFTIPVE